MHGVLHLKNDLNRNWNLEKCIAYLNYGVQCIKKFELKTGLSVSRLIVPPHERISEKMIEAITCTEIKGVITAGKVYGYTHDIRHGDNLAGMFPEYWVLDRVPVVLRDSLVECALNTNSKIRKRMKFRSCLDHPVIFESHHADFKNMDCILRNISHFVNELKVNWASISEIEENIYRNKEILSTPLINDNIHPNSIPFSLTLESKLRRAICILRDNIKAVIKYDP